MSTIDEGMWNGNWQIVRADLDLAHVFAPQDTISFAKNGSGYKVAHQGSAPDAQCFNDAVLRPVAGDQTSFSKLYSGRLPLFSSHHKTRYKDLAAKLEEFAQENPSVQRLEGTIQIPCHRYSHQAQESASDYHATRMLSTMIRVYQFADAVEEGKRLLVIYKPLDPSCASNGNGTVIAYD
jgi:hypothetical protein